LSFSNLNLIEPLLKALNNEGYTTPTPIQEQSIPIILSRKDLLGCAQTGTGKTAAFALPLLQLLLEDSFGPKGAAEPKNVHEHRSTGGARSVSPIRALILTPTRELAIQIGESFTAYGKFTGVKNLVIFGGVPQHSQVQSLQRGVDILVATPGRLLDLMEQRYVSLRDIQFFVLDEADRMLDMGFVHDVKKIIKSLPQKRQTLFFSATMPPEIQSLASTILSNPSKVSVTPESTTADTIQQTLYFVEKKDKKSLLLHLLKEQSIVTALVFTRTKHGADKVAEGLSRAGIRAEAIHGNKSQNARQRALQNFKDRHTRVLVATDIAARGIDIDELTHVINFELPNVPETYVHRIGRTGRAGASGIALSFCDAEEKEFLHDIQKLIGRPIPVSEDHPHVMHAGLSSRAPSSISRGNSSGGRNGSFSGNGNQRGGRQQNGNTGGRQQSGNAEGGQRNGSSGNGSQRSGRPPRTQRPPSFQVEKLQSMVREAGQQSEGRRLDDTLQPFERPHTERQHTDRQQTERQHTDRSHKERKPEAHQRPAQQGESHPNTDHGRPLNQSTGEERW
jgi:ATP-dependent RNA helicase RhlE